MLFMFKTFVSLLFGLASWLQIHRIRNPKQLKGNLLQFRALVKANTT